MISWELMMVYFYPMSWMRRVATGLTLGHRAGPGSTEGEFLAESECHPRYCALCQAWEHCSCHVVAKVRPVTEVHRKAEPHSCISVLPLAQVTSTERNTFLNSHSILTLLLHPLRRINCQIIRVLNMQASDINVLFRVVTLGALSQHSTRTEFIHLKRKPNIQEKELPHHILLNLQLRWAGHCPIDCLDDPWNSRERNF